MLTKGMPLAPTTPALRCPQCKATLAAAHKQRGDTSLHLCEFCETVVIAKQGDLKIAGRQHAGDKEVDWLHALCCRLCGGSMGLSDAASAEKAKCGYCGHRARLRPGILTVLRLLFTDPKLIPPSLRRRVVFSLAMVFATIAMTAFMVVQETGSRIESIEVDTSRAKAGDVVFDQDLDLPGFAKSLHLEADSRNAPNGLRLETLFVHHRSQTCLALRARPQRHRLRLGGIKVPGGSTRGFVRVLANSTPAANHSVARFHVRSPHKLSVGYMVLALNLLLWLSFASVKIGVDFQSTKRRAAQVTQGLALGFLGIWFCMTVLDFNPLGPHAFDPNDATRFSEHGLACEELLQEGVRSPPAPALVAALDEAIQANEKARAAEYAGLSTLLAAAPPPLELAPCTPSNGRSINKHQIEVIDLGDFQRAQKHWAEAQGRATVLAKRIALWRGRLSADESESQSLTKARSWARESNMDDHAVAIIEASTEGSKTGSARLFVWSYKKQALVCAAPPSEISDLADPDLEEALGRLRAAKSPASPL